MSFALSPLFHVLDIPSTKAPITFATFVSYIIPLAASYVLAAVLALTHRTRFYRIALWPVVAFLAFRAAVSVDLSHGRSELGVLNIQLMRCAVCICVHSLSWASAKKPLVRHLRPANSTPSIITDTLDLVTTFRGHEWDWSRGLHVPYDTRPTNRVAFAFYALLSSVWNGLICGGFHRVIHAFTRDAGLTPDGPSIFDETLPPFVRYVRASIISLLAVSTVYTAMQSSYNALTVLGILVFGQDTAQWPPAFDRPWLSTSQSDLWSRRWHQNYRHTFIVCAHPLRLLFGRVGGIIGAFLVSGVVNYLMMTGFGGPLELWRMMVGFGMMSFGIVLERTYYKWTGRKVGGIVGWIWTMSWLLAWGLLIVEGFSKAGMFQQPSPIESELKMWVWLENLTKKFDDWLHSA